MVSTKYNGKVYHVHVPSIQASQLHSTLLKGIYGCGDDKWWGLSPKFQKFFFGDGQIKEVIVKKTQHKTLVCLTTN
jgi:hypothetical protein